MVTTGGEGNSEASEQDVPGRARVTGPQRCQSGERFQYGVVGDAGGFFSEHFCDLPEFWMV